jgi:hypothetical protein
MKSFKEYLKQIAEDKVIAKEDEGVAAPAGDVSAPSGDSAPSGEVISTHQKTDGGLTTTDVLGKCDHKHDGFFGPGCFHRPFPIFSYPVSRIKKKKRKYIKVLDLTESEEYEIFRPLANSIIEQEIDEANKYLQKTGIKVFYEDDYDFSGKKKDWVGATDFERQEDTNNFGIAINLPVLYGFLEENSLENDETEIKCQIKATIYHEIGHCLVQKFKDDETYDFEMTENEEEKLVEEFANYMLREYTGVNSSKLNDFVNEVFGENLEEERIDETDQYKRGKFFENPINIDHPQRYVQSKLVTPDKVDANIGQILSKFKDIPVAGSEKVFSGEPIDYLVSLTENGFFIMTPQLPEDEKLQDIIAEYASLPDDIKPDALEILKSPEDEKFDNVPEQLQEFQINASYLDADQLKKALFVLKHEKRDGKIYLRPTVSDIIRTFHGKKDTLPLDLLTMIDDREHELDYRYDEAESDGDSRDVVSEEIDYDTRKWLCYSVLQREKKDKKYSGDRTRRWEFMTNQLGKNLENYQKLGDLVYKIYSKIKNPKGGRVPSISYVYSEMATLIGISESTKENQTFYYMGPSDVIKKLKDSKTGENDTVVLEGNDKVDDIPLEFLWTALMNVVYDRAFAGSERGTAQGRAKERRRF